VAYAISKAAMNMAVVKFAVALKKEGFVFLALAPGIVDTVVDPQHREAAQMYRSALAQVAPDFKGSITPRASVEMMLEVINRWTVGDTGAFVSQHGNKEWL
jgi:NAD(P)-dependent dehydrogenase (short-subunit alcohol dehydrogenase family)